MPTFLKKHKKTVIISFLLVIFIACLIVANYLSLFIVKTNREAVTIKSNSFDLYMISLNKSQIQNEAKSFAPEYQKIGAGGFIWEQDNYYHVISSAYSNKNDASLVQNSLKNQNISSEIITIHFKSNEINGLFNNEEAKMLTKTLNIFQEYYLSIYDIAISLDTAVLNEISARLAVNNTHHNLSAVVSNFKTLFTDLTLSPFKELNLVLDKALKISQNLCGGTMINAGQTYSSLLKYRYLEILNLLYEFEI